MKCPSCGADNHHNNSKCVKCGSYIASSTPHEKYGDLRCPDCGSNDLDIIKTLDGKVLDPDAKHPGDLLGAFKKDQIEIVRHCNKCGREF